MEFSPLGKSGLSISRIGLGAWTPYGYLTSGPEAFERGVCFALEQGINLIDTAEEYGQGRSEELIGRTLTKLGARKKFLISSKFCEYNSRPEDIRRSLEGSLRRLKTDYLDIYFQHWPSRDVPLQDTINELVRLKEAGLIRAIGASNWSLQEFEEISNCNAIDILQACHNMAWRVLETSTFPFCRKNEIAVVAYSPLAQGLLGGAYRTYAEVPKDSRERNRLVSEENMLQISQLLSYLDDVAKSTGRSVAQLAMRWVLDSAGNSGIISGAHTQAQLQDTIKILGWSLPAEVKTTIDSLTCQLSADLTNRSSLWNNHPRAVR